MDLLIVLLIVFVVVVTLVTVVGHAIWLLCEAVVRSFSDSKGMKPATALLTWHCQTCNSEVRASRTFCGDCGTPSTPTADPLILKDLAATERQIERFREHNRLEPNVLVELKKAIDAERIRLSPNVNKYQQTTASEIACSAQPEILEGEAVGARDIEFKFEEAPGFLSAENYIESSQSLPSEPTASTRTPRRSFSEVLNSFMEESNIRWGEIIGGLLIIGCSTALVVSLWSQISQIPVLKFLIFTTVTAFLFGIGMYTEHRWKLPTTSRGILTIATLLVPLNFLAIAAVSSSDSSGVLVLASELLAPAIFLCLVYFAGRVITPGCAHLVAAGILGSSVGQLLVRHLASADAAPELLVLLGAFPVMCYVASVGLALRFVLTDARIDEEETTIVFTILGTMSFAALLPFGLLLYKSGSLPISMMYLAPLVTLWGVPMLATGTVLWRRIDGKSLVGSRTTGTALGILGLAIAIGGMILAWPNPASIIPAALLNFAILTILGLVLEVPVAHVLAAGCFGLAYLVFFQVIAGHTVWQNLRVTSLLQACIDMSSGQALIGLFGIFLVVSDWLQHRKRSHESVSYLIAGCFIGLISLLLVTGFGPVRGTDLESVWLTYLIYSLGAFWIAGRRRLPTFTWFGSGLLLFALASHLAWNTDLAFPFQTALLIHASICTVAAIVSSRRSTFVELSQPLNYAALICAVLVVLSMFQTNPWQVTSMQAQRFFWIAGILLFSLWLNRYQLLLVALQIALTTAVILTVKATLQGYEWYTYLPHAFLHPSALQIQGTVLALLSLIWILIRLVSRKSGGRALGGFWKLLDTKYSLDRLIAWVLLGAFILLSIYGAISGIAQEFSLSSTQLPVFDIAGFPHNEAIGMGSWILLGLLAVLMLANAWERRQRSYLLGAVLALSAAIPLLSGRFEYPLATATAWRFLAALFFATASLLLWCRQGVWAQLKSLGWPSSDSDSEEFVGRLRSLLLALTVLPLLLFTFYAALRAIVRVPLQVPASGVFAILNTELSYAIPLIVVALVLIGHAIRERLPQFSFYAGLLFNLTVTLTYLLSLASTSAPLDAFAVVRTIQLNAVTSAVYALFWLSLRSRWLPALGHSTKTGDALLVLEMWMAVGFNLLLLVPFSFRIAFDQPLAGTHAAGNFLAWLSFVLAGVALVLVKRSTNQRISALILTSTLLCLVSLITFGLSGTNFIHLRVLTAGLTLVAWLVFALSYLPNWSDQETALHRLLKVDKRWTNNAISFSTFIGCLVTFLSLRLLIVVNNSDHWWSVVLLVALSALAAALHWRTLRRWYLYAAGFLFTIAVSIWWFVYHGTEIPGILPFLEANIIAASLVAILWVILELRSRRLRQTELKTPLSFHNVVVFAVVFLLAVITWFRFVSAANLLVQIPTLTWLSGFSAAALMIATFWDPCAKYATAGLYTLGLIGAAIGLQQLNLEPRELLWSVLMVLAVYSLGTSLLWRKRQNLISIAQGLGITPRIDPSATHLNWLAAVTIGALLTSGLIAYWINLSFQSLNLRISAAIGLTTQALTLGLLAEGAGQERWRRAAVGTLLVGSVLFGWAWLTPDDATWLNRSVILMVEALTFTALYGLWLDKIHCVHSGWAKSLGSSIPVVLGVGFTALFFCLGTEIFYQISFGSVLIDPISLVVIGITLVAAILIPVWFALSPAHDPLSLNERGGMKYVYAAELMLALLFMHIRLTMPWVFQGFFERYWPFVVMTVAYLGVISSESLRRRKLLILAEPMERTGAFLPLLPVVGFWLATSDVDYSSLLFVVGGLYGLLSLLRRSFVFGALAAAAGNAGLWYLLHRTSDYQFLQHPQLWLIPVALSVLLASYLNEDRLTDDQMATVRYLSLVTIYASSTADIFINGVADSPWLPLILGAFSLAGVFSGIMFRIRGLLLMGSVFLLLSIVTMIWYASANLGWTWLWYVAGIATGITIIFMFALFEKKRGDVLRVVEGIKDWEM